MKSGNVCMRLGSLFQWAFGGVAFVVLCQELRSHVYWASEKCVPVCVQSKKLRRKRTMQEGVPVCPNSKVRWLQKMGLFLRLKQSELCSQLPHAASVEH